MLLDDIKDSYDESEFKIADGFDEAVIGIDEKEDRLIYSVQKCVEILMERDGMTYEVAREFLDFNTIDAYVGEHTPIWCEDDF
jgi:hypothetical protein